MASSPLLTDLYQLTMAEAYWRSGRASASACFYMSFRDLPFSGGYAIACGMEHAAEFVCGFAFSSEDVSYLSSLPAPGGGKLFAPEFLATLKDMRLSLSIDAVPEGSAVFPGEPLLRVQGPITQCQLVETAILNAVNYETLIATKAARICEAAKAPVAEFGLRRAHGPAGGVYASRAAIVGGCSSTSNVEAGRLFGLPVSGTHAHSWVMAFESELEAFRAFAAAFPHNCTLLVDTYDVMAGVDNAIIVALEMAARGEQLSAIRIDSGDLAWLSKRARAKLDEAGLHDVRIVASNDLDEFTINSLLHEQDAAIDAWGVGTKLVTAAGQASLGGVYKMCALREAGEEQWQPRMKLSAQLRKSTLPGMLSLRRYFDNNGVMAGDMVYSADEQAGTGRIIDPFDDLRQKDLGACSHEELLLPLVRAGEPVGEPLGALAAQARAKASLDALDPSNKRLLNPHSYPVGLSIPLHQLRASLIKRFRGLA